MPLVARHSAITIDVEIREPVASIVVFLILSQEFRVRDHAVVVVVRAPEAGAIEVPFVAADSAVSVVIQRAEPALGPVVELVLAIRRVEIGIVLRRVAPPRADADLVAGKDAVVIPVVDFERLIAAAPLVARDDPVVVGIHLLETHGAAGLRRSGKRTEDEGCCQSSCRLPMHESLLQLKTAITVPTAVYSARSASTGSMAVARSAGT